MTPTPATKHQHHFEDLSPDDFERFVYYLVKRCGDFDEVQWYGGARDKGRDVVAYKHAATGREKWYIQCKRYKSITFSTLRDELDKLAQHAQAEPDFGPDVVVFATACPVPPQARDQAAAHARALNLPQPYYWGRLELDERLKAQPDTEEEFFGTPSPSPQARVDLRNAHVGGSVVTGDLTMTGSRFVGRDQIVAQTVTITSDMRDRDEAKPLDEVEGGEKTVALLNRAEQVKRMVDHNRQLKLDDTIQPVIRMPVAEFEALSGEQGPGTSKELLQAVQDYLDCAHSINSFIDNYRALLSSGSGVAPTQMGVSGSSYCSDVVRKIVTISEQQLPEILERLATCLQEETCRPGRDTDAHTSIGGDQIGVEGDQ